MRDRTKKTRAVSGLVATAFAALNAIVPAASAQVTSERSEPMETLQVADSVETASDPLAGATQPVTVPTGGGIPNGTTSSVDNKLGETTGAVGETTGAVGETTGAVGGAKDVLDKNNDGVVGDTVGGITDTGDETVKQAKKTVKDTTNQTHGFKNTVGDGLGGTGIVAPNLSIEDPLGGTDRNAGGSAGGSNDTKAGNGADGGGWRMDPQKSSDRRHAGSADRKSKQRRAETRRIALANGSAATSQPAGETFFTQLADAAVGAAQKLAFPLGLALMVGAFLIVQGRIDRKDDKLVLAPIDSEQDLLRFQ